MDELIKDIRYGWRTLMKSPGFALATTLTLGLGIGANTAIFSLISGVLLKPLPYANEERLVLLRQSAPLSGRANMGVSVKEYYDYREQVKEFEDLVEYHQMNFDLLKRGEPDRVQTGVVSHNFFDVLGIKPILGRSFVKEDDLPGAEAVLILSYSYWQSKFSGDPNIVNQVFQMNDRPHRVIGVLPNVPHYPSENAVYMSVSACPFRAAAEGQIHQNPRAFSILSVFGKLKPGVSREAAGASVATICRRFTGDHKDAYRPGSGFMATLLDVREQLTQNARPMLLILLGAAGLILLIACANVANLTVARVLRRDRELALRGALGADRARLIRQLLTESSIIALSGGILGLVFAVSTLGMLTRFVARFTVRTGEIGVDLRVLAFAIIVSLGTGLFFGILPALASKVDLATAMKQGGKGSGPRSGRKRLTNGLIVAQVTVSVVLLTGAGLLLASFYRLQKVDPGYRADQVTSADIFTNFSRYPNLDTQLRMYLPVLERLEGTPGVVSAAVTNAVPLSTLQPAALPFQIEGRVIENPDARPTADGRIVSAGYFKTLGIPLIQGRFFEESDGREAPPVVVINRSMMRYWEGRDPIGSRLSTDNGQTWSTVVGIAGDVKQFGLDRESVAQVYVPLRQTTQGLAGRVLVRTSGDPGSAARIIREAVRSIDPDMPITNLRTLEEIRSEYLATPRLTAVLLTLFAGLALLVTMAGLAGVIGTSVSQRTQEFGLRMALGARRHSVLGMVVKQGLRLVVIGLSLGVALSYTFTRSLSSYLFDTRATDPAALAAVLLTFVAAGVLACLGPALRATSVDPLIALRAE
ncbi:MAG: ABC transporter permease [Vicinamibacteria bacterium]|nr:ABC transporter permease [Vicinamibacteria bacterium]